MHTLSTGYSQRTKLHIVIAKNDKSVKVSRHKQSTTQKIPQKLISLHIYRFNTSDYDSLYIS